MAMQNDFRVNPKIVPASCVPNSLYGLNKYIIANQLDVQSNWPDLIYCRLRCASFRRSLPFGIHLVGGGPVRDEGRLHE